MKNIRSQDGPSLAFDQSGKGPAIILVSGAFNDQASGAPLAARLSERFTVFNYDRRGRGASSETAPYAIAREIDDLAVLIKETGGSTPVFGHSSGALLALMAAHHPTRSSIDHDGTAMGSRDLCPRLRWLPV